MKLYAETTGRRTRQLLLDLLLLGWIGVWVSVAGVVHGLVLRLAGPGRALQDAGGQIDTSLRDAARQVSGVPLVGRSLRGPLRSAAAAGRRLQDAGVGQQTAVERLALVLALVVALAPVLAVLLRYLPDRVRWIRNATAADRLRGTRGDLDVFALRALTRQPLWRLSQLGPDPAGAYLRREPGAAERLAGLELAGLGLLAGLAEPGQPGESPAGGRLGRP